MKRLSPAPGLSGLLLALALSACAMGSAQPRLANPDPASNPPATAGDRAPPADGVITVRPGDTVYAVARQYGVSPRTIIEANRLAPPYLLHVGDRLFLPVPRVHVVKAGDTLSEVARTYRVDFQQLVTANSLRPPYAIRVGQQLRLPGAPGRGDGTLVAARAPQSPPPQSAPAPAATDPTRPWSSAGSLNFPMAGAPAPAPVAGGSAPPPVPAASEPSPAGGIVIAQAPPPPPPAAPAATPSAVTSPSAPVPAGPAPAPRSATVEATESAVRAAIVAPPPRGASRFLWPVDGRVIAGFGPREGGLHNDGINIAAERGTSIRAAENGVVVYAGNELPGFGWLLLINHADGWTTAYAHADTLLVRRGDRVTRGQPIATVGQTGNVDRPQLHFEIRKKSRAVDPRDELAPARA